MMNVIEIQDALKGMPMEQLIREMQMPSGQAPQFLVLGEIARRKQMEKEFAQRQGQPQTTVAEDAVTAAGVPQQGIASAARAMAPQTDMVMNTAPTQQLPVQGMADGGYVQKMQVGGSLSGPPAEFYTDPSVREMARRQGISIEQYWNALSDEAKAAQMQLYSGRSPSMDRDVTRVPSIADVPALPTMPAMFGGFSIPPEAQPERPTLAMRGTEREPRAYTPTGAGIEALLNTNNMGLDFDATYGASDTFDLPEGMQSEIARAAAEAAQAAPPRGLAGLTVPPYALRGEPEPVPVSGPAFGNGRVDFMGPIGPGGERIFAQPDFDPASVTAYNAAIRAKREAEAAALEADRLATDARMAAAAGMPAEALARRADDARAKADRLAAAAQAAESGAESLVAEEVSAADAAAAPKVETLEGGTTPADAVPVPPLPPGRVTPPSAAPTTPSGGIAAAMSPFETELTNLLQQREKRAEQDKWLALAQVGMSLMGSRQPTFAGALGEAGAAGLQQFQQGRAQYDKDRLELMALLENTRLARAKLAAASTPKARLLPDEVLTAFDDEIEATRAALSDPLNPPTPDEKMRLTAQLNNLLTEKANARGAFFAQYGYSMPRSAAPTGGVYSKDDVRS